MGKVLFLVNHDVVIYNFRRELVERLIQDGYEVVISSPYGERIELLKQMGCRYVEVEMDRHGKNPFKELKLRAYYRRLISSEKPKIIFSYTIKPNLYGAMAAKANKVPIVVNVTGLGTAVENSGFMGRFMSFMYKRTFHKVQTVYVQNEENKQYFIDRNIATDRLKLLPGSGVNLDYFHLLDYPDEKTIEFAFISRIMKEKGIDQFLQMAEYIKEKYPKTRFHICGFCEEEYEQILEDYERKGIITYHGMVMDVRKVLAVTHCTVHPTYYPEGISNVLLESASCGRPIIATDRSGCREVIDDGINGFVVKQQDSQDLIEKIEKFIKLSYEQKKKMGLAGRAKVEREFDRKIVVDSYLQEIERM